MKLQHSNSPLTRLSGLVVIVIFCRASVSEALAQDQYQHQYHHQYQHQGDEKSRVTVVKLEDDVRMQVSYSAKIGQKACEVDGKKIWCPRPGKPQDKLFVSGTFFKPDGKWTATSCAFVYAKDKVRVEGKLVMKENSFDCTCKIEPAHGLTRVSVDPYGELEFVQPIGIHERDVHYEVLPLYWTPS